MTPMPPRPASAPAVAPHRRATGRAGLAALMLAAAAALPAGAAPDPVLVPPLPELAPADQPDPARDLAPLRDAATPPAPPSATAATADPAAGAIAPAADGVLIQVGSFRVPGNARASAEALTRAGLTAAVEGPLAGGLHRVLVGPVAQDELAGALARLAKAGYADAFVLARPPRGGTTR